MDKPRENISTEVQLLESIFENALDAKIVVNSDNRVVKANKASHEVFGIDPHGYSKIFSFFPNSVRIELKRLLEMIHDSDRIRTEIHIKLHGSIQYFDLSISSLMDSTYTLLIFRDITPTVLSRQSRDMFLSVAGHEIKTPLAVIQSYADLLLRRLSLNDENKQYFEKISQNVDILSNYVNSIVDEIKIGTGKFEYNDTEENLDQLIEDFVLELQAVYKKRIIHLSGKTGCMLTIDRLRLKQVIANLINNAFKYSPKDAAVFVKLKCVDNHAIIEITDRGPGISKKDQKKIFEAFFRTEKAYSKKSGLGLGLYIAHQIVTHYKGTITVKSKYRKGSTFSVRFPTAS